MPLFKYIAVLIFLTACTTVISFNKPLYAQTNLEVFNKSIENLPTQNKLDVILDSADKYYNSNIIKCVSFGELALNTIDSKITEENKGEVYFRVSKYYLTMGNYSKALEYMLTDLKILESAKFKNELLTGRCYVNLGEIYRAATDYENALQNLNHSVIIYSEIKSPEGEKGLAHSYERLAAVYFEMCYKNDSSYVNKAIEYASKSLELSEKYGLTSRKINNWNILGACQIINRKYDTSLELFTIALKETYNDSTYTDRCNILNNIASCYYHMKNYKKSIEYAQQSYDESKKRGVAIYVREASLFLHKSFLGLKDYEKAIFYLNEYDLVSAELFSNEKNRAIDALEQKYNMAKEDEAHRDEKNNLIFLSIGILFISLLCLVFFFIRQKSLKKINRELELKNSIITEQKSELEEVNAVKNKFFSILAHDLRNPFNGILGFLSLLKNDFDTLTDQEKKQYLGYVNSSADQVFKLLERLLQLSRLQEGRYTINIEDVNLKEITEQIYKLQETNAVNKRVQLVFNFKEDIYVKADKTSIDIVLRNLIDNAVKFTSAGGKVEINLRDKKNKVEISVEDSGVGMEKEDMENIFRMEKQTVSIGTNNEKGTGLGLVVCKELIEKMDGEIKVSSEIGKGSKFTVILPK